MAPSDSTPIHYDRNDYDFVSRLLGFSDDPADGNFTQQEQDGPQNTLYRDFIDQLATDQREHYLAALRKYDSARPLATKNFLYPGGRYDTTLAVVAREHVRFRTQRFLSDNGLPATIDPNYFNPLYKYPLGTTKSSSTQFDAVAINLESFRNKTPFGWLMGTDSTPLTLLKRADFSQCPTPTVEILRGFVLEPLEQGDQAVTITRAGWEEAYWEYLKTHPCPVAITHTVESTWNELLLMWQRSDEHWHVLLTDTGIWIATGIGSLVTDAVPATSDFARAAESDMTITANGFWDYVSYWKQPLPPRREHQGHGLPAALVNADLAMENVWRKETRLAFALKGGTELALRAAAGAKLSVNQEIDGAALACAVTEPLVYLEGITIDPKDNPWWAKAVGWYVRQPRGITVFQNRLCLMFNEGIHGDLAFIDIGPFVKAMLDKQDPAKKTSHLIFTSDNQVFGNVSVNELIAALIPLFQADNPVLQTSSGIDTALANVEFQRMASDLWVNDIQLDLSGVAAALPESPKIGITNLSVSDGDVYATRDLANGKFFAQGRMNLDVDLQGSVPGTEILTQGARLGLEFFVDGIKKNHDGKYVGWARVTLPKMIGPDLGTGGEAEYNGSIMVALAVEGFDTLLESGDPTQLLEAINAQVAIELQKNGKDFLAALITAEAMARNPDYATFLDHLKDYRIGFDLAVADDGGQATHAGLAGIVAGKTFYGVEVLDYDPVAPYSGFTLNVNDALVGGIASLFAGDVVLAIYKEDDSIGPDGKVIRHGAIHIVPRARSIDTLGDAVVHSENLGGEIVITPVPGADGKVTHHRIEVRDISISIPNAEIVMPGNPEAETELARADKIVRGGIHEAKLTGVFDVKPSDETEPSFFDVVSGENWVLKDGEHAGLTLTLDNLDVRVVNATTGEELTGAEVARFKAEELSAKVIDIAHVSFNPAGLAGALASQIKDGIIAVTTDTVSVSGDIRHHDLRIDGPILPDVRFEAPRPERRLKGASARATVLQTHEPTLAQSSVVDDRMHADHNPIERAEGEEPPFAAKNEIYENLYLFMRQFTGFAESVVGFDIDLNEILLLPDAEYKYPWIHGKAAPRHTHYPDLNGFAQLFQGLMPKTYEDTRITEGSVTIKGKDYHITEFDIGMRQPKIGADGKPLLGEDGTPVMKEGHIDFLGMRFTGIAIAKPRCPLKDGTQSHLYLTTENYRLDVLAFMNLFSHAKMTRLRERLHQRMVDKYLSAHLAAYEAAHGKLSTPARKGLEKHFGDYGRGKKRIPAELTPVFDFITARNTQAFTSEFDRPLRVELERTYRLALRPAFAEEYKAHFRVARLIEDYSAVFRTHKAMAPDPALLARIAAFCLKNGLNATDVPLEMADFFSFARPALEKDPAPYTFSQALIDDYLRSAPDRFQEVPEEIFALTQFVEMRLAVHLKDPANQAKMDAEVAKQLAKHTQDEPERAAERDAFVAKRHTQLYQDYDLGCREIPDNTADFITYLNEFILVFGVADEITKKKKPKADSTQPALFGVDNNSAVSAELDLRLKPFEADIVGTHVAVTRENDHPVSADVVYRFNRATQTGVRLPFLGVDVADAGGELLEHVHVASDGPVKLVSGLTAMRGLAFMMDGNINNGGPWQLGIDQLVLEEIAGDYNPGPNKTKFAASILPHDTAVNPNYVVVHNFTTGLYTDAEDSSQRYYHTHLQIPEAAVGAGYLYLEQVEEKLVPVVDPNTDEPVNDESTGAPLMQRQFERREAYYNHSGSSYRDFEFTIDSRRFNWAERADPATSGIALVNITGEFNQSHNPTLQSGEPWAVLQIGSLQAGDEEIRQHLFIERISMAGLDIAIGGKDPIPQEDNVPIHFSGDLSLLIALPMLLDPKLAQAQKDLGITANISHMEVGGTMEFTLDGETGSIRRITPTDGPQIPVTIRLVGEVIIEVPGTDITLSDIVVPIDAVALELVRNATDDQTASFKSITTPPGETIRAATNGYVMLPNTRLGRRGISLNDGTVEISASEGISVGMDDASDLSTLHTNGDITDFRFLAKAGQNVLDLKAGKIYYRNNAGTVQSFSLSVDLLDYFYKTLVHASPLISGDTLTITKR